MSLNSENSTVSLREPPRLAGLRFTEQQKRECLRNRGILRATLEFSPACNLRCAYCYASNRLTHPPANPLSKTECLRIVTEIARAGAKSVILIGGGEPLLCPFWRDIAMRVRQSGMTPVVFTNGVFLDEEAVRFLDGVAASFVLKMDSLDHAIQDVLSGKTGTGEAIQNAAGRLLDHGFTDPDEGRLAIQAVVCKTNVHSLPKLWRWARNNAVIPMFQLMTPQGAGAEKALQLSHREARDFFEEILVIDQREFGYTWVPQPPYLAGNCEKFLYNIYVRYTADVTPCVGVDLFLGNVRHQQISEILSSPQMAQIRNVRNNLHGTCRSCPRADRCYGCRGAAYAATGDPFASDPTCWRSDD